MRTLLLSTIAMLGLSGVARAATVADTLTSDPRFSHITELVQRAGLLDGLRGAGRVTVFAPVNAAFDRVPANVLAEIAPQGTNQDYTGALPQLQSLVRIHLIAEAYPAEALIGQRATIADEAGTYLLVDGTQAGVLAIATVPTPAGGPNTAGLATQRVAQVVGVPLVADNGVIYPIDNVLLQ